mgnify:CR=1 FL=1
MIRVKEVKSVRDFIKFVNAEYEIKKDDKNFVPPLFIERFITLRWSAFLKHGKAKFFIAEDEKNKTLGRISAQIDFLYTEKEKTGFFGFFECVNSQEVANSLFQKAEDFLRSEGMEKIRGPFSFNINGESGLLVDGFGTPPFVMMPHNPPYYAELIENYGFKKAKDLFAWEINREDVEKKTSSLLKLIWKESGDKIKVREITKKNLKEDIKIAVEIFNDAWSENWGFIPITYEEGQDIANSLKLVLDSKIAFFALIEDEPAGVCIAVPNINEALKNTKGGKNPLELIKILLNLKKIKSIRLLILGVKKKFRKDYPYLPLFMVGELIKRGKERGYEKAELSWTLEDNERINKIIKISGGRIYKVYRVYEKEL